MILPKPHLSSFISEHIGDSQFQPAGVDVTLKKIMEFSSAGQIDFDNTERKISETKELPFEDGWVSLEPGCYKVIFNEYVKIGYYPFFLENEFTYHKKLEEIINVVMEIDLLHAYEITLQSIEKIKKLLYVISSSAPFKPNIQKISEKINSTRNSVKTYLHYLHRAKVINLLHAGTKGISMLQKPEKIYFSPS